MVKAAVEAHSPVAGVNVYAVVCMLSNEGLHVPVMPLLEVKGKADSAEPSQIGFTGSNKGVCG